MGKPKKQINVDIGRRICLHRKRIGMTREDLAERVEITPRFEADIERGTVGPSLTTLKQFCKVLGVTSDSILLGESDVVDLNARLVHLDSKYYADLDSLLRKQVELIHLAEGGARQPSPDEGAES
ncbi:MAG: helix-turn-helix domain-containing protein [Clostridia bacterium]